MTTLIFIAVMLLLMWLLFVAPQRRRQQAQKNLLESIDVGDEVLTAGGVYARVLEVREDDLTVEFAPGTIVRLDKRAVAVVVPPDDAAAAVEEPAELDAPAAETPPGHDRTQASRS